MNKQDFLNEWLNLSEKHLIDILQFEDSSNEQLENAVIILKEKFGYSIEQICEIAPIVSGIIGGIGNLGLRIAGSRAIGKVVKSGIGIENARKKASDWMNKPKDDEWMLTKIAKNFIKTSANNLHPFKKDIHVRSLDDYLPGGSIAKHFAKTDDDKEKNNNAPLKPKQPESPLGLERTDNPRGASNAAARSPSIRQRASEYRYRRNNYKTEEIMNKKDFKNFREELNVDNIFVEDLSENDLFSIIKEDSGFDNINKAISIIELFNRDLIKLTEEEYAAIIDEAGLWDTVKSGATKLAQKAVGTTPDGKWGPKSSAALSNKISTIKKWATTPITTTKDDNFNVLNRAATATKKALPNAPKDTAWANLGKPSSNQQGAKPTSNPIASKPVTPKPASNPSTKPSVSKSTNNAGVKSQPSFRPNNDLVNTAKNMLGATRGAAGATANMVNKVKPLSNVGRMDKPTSPGGQTSNQIHGAIAKLGGEPTRSTPKPVVKLVSKPLPPTTQGAPRASSSKPPSGGKWIP